MKPISIIRKTLRKFGAQAFIAAIASDLESEAKHMEDIYPGGGRNAEVWAEELRLAISRSIERLNTSQR